MTRGMRGIVMSALIFYEPSGWSLSLAAGMLPSSLSICLFASFPITEGLSVKEYPALNVSFQLREAHNCGSS